MITETDYINYLHSLDAKIGEEARNYIDDLSRDNAYDVAPDKVWEVARATAELIVDDPGPYDIPGLSK